MPYELTNPRFFPGNICGLAMETDENGRKVDTRYGVNLNHTDGCLIEHPGPGRIAIAYALGGTVDATSDVVRGLYLLNAGIAAHVVTELTSLLHRMDPEAAVRLVASLHHLIDPPYPAPVSEVVDVPVSPGDVLVASGVVDVDVVAA